MQGAILPPYPPQERVPKPAGCDFHMCVPDYRCKQTTTSSFILFLKIFLFLFFNIREKLQSSWPQNFRNSRAACLQAHEETNKAGLWVETSWQITQRWPWCRAASTQNPAAWSCTAINTNWKPKQWAPLHHEDIESILHCTSHNEKGFKSCQSSQSHQLLFTQCQPSTATKLNKMRKPLPAPCSQGPHYCQV